MKNIITFILIVFSLSAFSQAINFPEKKQPMKVNKFAFADTVFIDTASIYDVNGSNLGIVKTTDGRFYFKTVSSNSIDTAAANFYVLGDLFVTGNSEADTVKGNQSQFDALTGAGIFVSIDASGNLYKNNIGDSISSYIPDTAKGKQAQFDELTGAGIFVSIDASGNLYKNNIDDSVKSYIADSSHWDRVSTTHLVPQYNDSIVIGNTTRLTGTVLQVNGQINQTPVPFAGTANDYNAMNGNVVFVSGTGDLESIINCAVGTEIEFSIASGASLQIDPADFVINSQTIRTLSGATLTLDSYDVVTIRCVAVGVFVVVSQSGDNQ